MKRYFESQSENAEHSGVCEQPRVRSANVYRCVCRGEMTHLCIGVFLHVCTCICV